MPFFSNSFKKARDESLDAPDLEIKMKFFAPLSAIHFVMLRPKPPRPPEMRYDALESNRYLGVQSGTT